MAATDQDLRRRFNEAQLRSFRDREWIGFLCECEQDCRRTVVLSAADYESRRPAPILHAAHGRSD